MVKNNAIVKSFFWNALETYATQGILFLTGVIMARLLLPSDYGILGIITIFIAISDTLIDSGFTMALIRKEHCTQNDYSTVFYFNISISLCLFLLLYAAAPFIAEFYRSPVLLWTTRAMGLTFVITSIGAISKVILVKKINFKGLAIITLITSIFSGITGITLAYKGFGVWSLVIQAVFAASLRMLITVFYAGWHPRFVFSKASFKELFGFGSKVLGSNLLNTLHSHLYSLIIGKTFSPASLGFYTRADGYSRLIPINIGGVLNKILLPVLAQIQNDDEQLINYSKKITSITSFFIFPGCMIMAGLAYPMIYLMISEKWIATVPLLQILCIAAMFEHLVSINMNFLLIKGQSGLVLKQQILTKPISVIILVVSLLGGLKLVAFGKVVYAVIALAISFVYLRKVLAISLRSLGRNLCNMLALSVFLGLFSFLSFLYLESTWVNLVAVAVIDLGLYLLGAKLLFPDILNYIITLQKNIKCSVQK